MVRFGSDGRKDRIGYSPLYWLDIFPPLHIITPNAQRQVVGQLNQKAVGSRYGQNKQLSYSTNDARRPASQRNPLCLTPSQGVPQNSFCVKRKINLAILVRGTGSPDNATPRPDPHPASPIFTENGGGVPKERRGWGESRWHHETRPPKVSDELPTLVLQTDRGRILFPSQPLSRWERGKG